MKNKNILLALLAVCIALAVTSCDQLFSSLFGTSIEARIDAFEQTLNMEDRSDMLNHFHPEMNNYNQLKDLDIFEDSYLAYANQPFTISSPEVDENDVAVCSFQHTDATGTIEFTMALDDYDYKILKLKLTLDDVPEPLELKRLLERQ